MAKLAASLILASASPRRRELLAQVEIDFDVKVSRVEEKQLKGESPEDFVTRMARAKMADVLDEVRRESAAPYVLSADTIVVVDGEILGKPADVDQAAEMLRSLLAREHEVQTAVALGHTGEGLVGERRVTTRVRFRAADEAEVKGYVATGEGLDKAGGYGIQGVAGGLVESIEGSYSNVVGLPLVETLALLREAGILVEWP